MCAPDSLRGADDDDDDEEEDEDGAAHEEGGEVGRVDAAGADDEKTS